MTPRVSLARESDRAATVARALTLIADDVQLDGCRQVLVKPNLVSTTRQLASTHVDALSAVLAFVRKRFDGRLIVGEGSALAHTGGGFERFGFVDAARRYGADLVDLNADAAFGVQVRDRRGRPRTLRLARTVVDSDYRISVGPPKTHDTVVVTLALKNMIMGSLLNPTVASAAASDAPPRRRGPLSPLVQRALSALGVPEWARARLHLGAHSDKIAMHQGYPTINWNLAALAPWVRPHLAVIDGWQAMEGAGPVDGDAVDWRIALAGTDALAVDVFTAHLMGFDLADIGYLTYCRRMGLGESDVGAIDCVGGVDPNAVRRAFRPHPTYRQQVEWHDAGPESYPERAPAVVDGPTAGDTGG